MPPKFIWTILYVVPPPPTGMMMQHQQPINNGVVPSSSVAMMLVELDEQTVPVVDNTAFNINTATGLRRKQNLNYYFKFIEKHFLYVSSYFGVENFRNFTNGDVT